MLIILPPSETKSPGGDNPPVNFDALSYPELNPIRRKITRDLQRLEVDEALEVLKISQRLRPEAEANRHLLSTPTTPALLRYTGVLYAALDAPSLPDSNWERLAIGSALFGILGARDLIPHYRLSGGTKLPTSKGESPTMKARWGSAISQVLTQSDQLVVDLRSGTYQQLGKAATAVTVRVETVQPDGTRKVVSHFNKYYKGQLARILATSATDAYRLEDVAAIARSAGLQVEERAAGRNVLTLVV